MLLDLEKYKYIREGFSPPGLDMFLQADGASPIRKTHLSYRCSVFNKPLSVMSICSGVTEINLCLIAQ